MAKFFDQAMKKTLLGYVPTWIHPNYLTVARALLVVPVCLLRDRPIEAISLLILSSLLDILDGPLARVRRISSQFGAWLDSMGDKVFILPPLFCLVYDRRVSLELACVIAAIEAALVIVRIVKERYKVKADSNAFGAIKTWTQSFGLAFILTQNTYFVLLAPAVLGLAIAAAVFSLTFHFRDFRRSP